MGCAYMTTVKKQPTCTSLSCILSKRTSALNLNLSVDPAVWDNVPDDGKREITSYLHSIIDEVEIAIPYNHPAVQSPPPPSLGEEAP